MRKPIERMILKVNAEGIATTLEPPYDFARLALAKMAADAGHMALATLLDEATSLKLDTSTLHAVKAGDRQVTIRFALGAPRTPEQAGEGA